MERASVSQESIIIVSDSDFSSQGWSGNGSASDPYIIEIQDISTNVTCLSISNTTSYFEIRDCQFESYWYEDYALGYDAVLFWNVTNGLIQDCAITGSAAAVLMVQCSNVNITRNTLESTFPLGVRAIRCDNCHITRNYGQKAGIQVEDATLMNISDNRISESESDGMRLDNVSSSIVSSNSIIFSTGMGLIIDHSSFTEVSLNTIVDSGEYGLSAVAFSCTFVENTIAGSHGYGIDLEGSDNVLYGNLFLSNVPVNARDRGTNNTWDDSVSVGNYWAGYVGFGPYLIDGSSGSEDRFPQGYPGIPTPVQISVIILIPVIVILLAVVMKRRRG